MNTRGEVHHTIDGGATWRIAAYTPGVFWRAVGFATPQIGWAGNLNRFSFPARDSALWESRDGGETWNNISGRIVGPMPLGICGIWVLDAQTVFAVGRWPGSAIFLKSTDGGRNWISRDLKPLATTLIDVVFKDAKNGFALGGTGYDSTFGSPHDQSPLYPLHTVILRTTDGGETWRQVYVSSTRRTWGWKMAFVTDQVAYASTEGIEEGLVVKTVDGGETWRQVNSHQLPPLMGVGFITVDSGWVGSQDALFETTDGGITWVKKELGAAANRFRFLSNGSGYAVGRAVYRFRR